MTFNLLLILFFLSGCNQKEIDNLKQEIHELRTEVREVEQIKYEIDALRQEFKKQAPATINNVEINQNSAIVPKNYKSTKSELDDPFLGDKNSEVTLMMFTDHQCKLCVNFLASNLENIKKDYTSQHKVKFILRDHPLATNSQAFSVANFANCAGEQGKYWDALNVIISKPELVNKAEFKQISAEIKGIDANKLLRCTNRMRYEKEIELDRADAKTLGLSGVPSFYVGKIKNAEYAGYLIRGAQPYNVLKSQVEKVLKSE